MTCENGYETIAGEWERRRACDSAQELLALVKEVGVPVLDEVLA